MKFLSLKFASTDNRVWLLYSSLYISISGNDMEHHLHRASTNFEEATIPIQDSSQL